MSNIATLPAPGQAMSVSTQAMVFDPQVIEGMYRMAEMMAAARITIPKHLAGSPSDCLAVVMQAAQFKMNPFAVAQATHIVNGTLGYEAKLVSAVISSSSLLKTRIAYDYEGDWSKSNGKADKDDSRAVTVYATIRGESEPRRLRVSMAQVGDVRNSPLWVTDPRQQLAYLATKRWARLHAPDVMLGVYTVDDLEDAPERDMGAAQVVEPTPSSSRTADVKAKLAGKRKPTEPAAGLDDVLSAIASAETADALKAAATLAGKLGTDEDKAVARQAYADRKAALEATPPLDLEPVDAVAGILAGIARANPEDAETWLEEAHEQGLSSADIERVEAAIEARKAA